MNNEDEKRGVATCTVVHKYSYKVSSLRASCVVKERENHFTSLKPLLARVLAGTTLASDEHTKCRNGGGGRERDSQKPEKLHFE